MPRLSIFYVYILHSGNAAEPFYVGKGKGARKGLHVKQAIKGKHPNAFLQNKILKEMADGNQVLTDVVFETESEDQAFAFEKELIAKYGRRDLGTGILTNLTDGGPGCVQEWWEAPTRENLNEARAAHALNVQAAVTKAWQERTAEERASIMLKIRAGHTDDWHKKAAEGKRAFHASETNEQRDERIAKHKAAASKVDWAEVQKKTKKAKAEWSDAKRAEYSEKMRQAALKRWSKQ